MSGPAPLSWIPNPGIQFQAVLDQNTYYSIIFPALNPSGYVPGKYAALANKLGSQGWSVFYEVAGGPWDNAADAQQACQNDYDQYGLTIPASKDSSLVQTSS